MPKAKFSNDIDSIPPTQTKKTPKGDPPNPQSLPDFDPLRIQKALRYGAPYNIPDSYNTGMPIDLFDLFFTNEELDEFVSNTNENARLNPYHDVD